MIALVGAMFVALPGASAAPAVGDVTDTKGVCETSGDTITGSSTSATVTVLIPDGDDNGTELDSQNVPCDSDTQGGATVSITPDGTISPIVQALAPALTLTLSDSDGVVSAGTDLLVTVGSSNLNSEDATATDQWVRVSGEIDHPWAGAPEIQPADASGTLAGHQYKIVIPIGTTPGEYTVSALAYLANGATDSSKRLSNSATFTVGDPGTNAASVALSFANEVNDDPKTAANERVVETGMTSVGGEIWLKVAATNSREAKSNDGAGVLNSLTVIAPGGNIEIHAPAPGDSLNHMGTAEDANKGDDSASFDNPQDVMYVKVTKKGSQPKPGSVTVYALLIGSDGAPRSEAETLHFTGSASTLELGDVANTGAGEQTEFTINANDAGGSNATINRVSFRVTKKDDGSSVGQSIVKVEQSTQGKYTTTTDADDNSRQVTGLITTGSKAPAGVYTIAVSIVGVADSTTTAELVVTGKATDVAVMTDKDEVEIGKIVTVTAEVTDKQGALVADGTKVNFVAAGAFDLTAIDDDDVEEGGANVTTKDGMAEVRFVAVKGSGTSTIIVTAVNPDGSKASNTKSVMSVATEEEAMPEEEAGLSCLSSLSGFSTWTCDVEASASEIFGWISSRGATALHLNSNRMWVRYSVVDGAMVPGSSDFMVTKSDILYISN